MTQSDISDGTNDTGACESSPATKPRCSSEWRNHATQTDKLFDNEMERVAMLKTEDNPVISSAKASIDLNDSRHESGAIEISECKQVIEENNATDGGWGWFIVLGCLLLRTIMGGLGRSHGLFYIQFQEKFGGSATSTALITSLCGFVRLAAGPIVSILCSRFSSRLLTCIGAGLLSIGLILTGYAPNQQFLYFSYGAVSGLGRAFALTPCPILLGYYFNKRRSLAFGLASAGFSIGGFVITPIVELLFQNFGFEGTFLILSAFALNVFVSSSLFRSIEQHRKLTNGKRKTHTHIQEEHVSPQVTVVDLDHLNSGTVLSSSMISIYSFNSNSIQTSDGIHGFRCNQKENAGLLECDSNVVDVTSKEKEEGKNAKKMKLISWSILKDARFLCFVFATFCFKLPTCALFLPSLAKSKGVTDIQAATLLSAGGGFDTLFRVISGIVLDLKVFRSIRPQIFNVMTFLQAIVTLLFPFVTSFPAFMILCAFEGAAIGVSNAQASVIMVDMLGVEKLASSMAVTMTVQGLAAIIGPTISGLLKDIYGTYDGAFYFASGAILLGGIVMAVGNIRKHLMDRKKTNS